MKKATRQKSDKYWKNKLDTAMSALVRSKGFCEHCQRKYDRLEWAHVISRSNRSLRWDIFNAMCLCSRCHRFFWHDTPLEASKWFQKTFPFRYIYLLKVKDIIKKPDIEEMKKILEYINDKDLVNLIRFRNEYKDIVKDESVAN